MPCHLLSDDGQRLGGCEGSAFTVGLRRRRRRHRPVVRGRELGDVIGGFEGGAQLGDGGGRSAQRRHHVQEVVGAALAAGGHALGGLGGHLGGALEAGAGARVLAAQQGQETPVTLDRTQQPVSLA